MNFWNLEHLKNALPDARFINFPPDFSSIGVYVTTPSFTDGGIILARKPDEIRGILEAHFKLLKGNIGAILCEDADYFEKYGLPIIEVKDSAKTITELALYKRSKYTGTVIDITGSSGKSTTTKMCYDALKEYGASANLTQANTNFGLAWNQTSYDTDNPYWINETSLSGGMDLNSNLTKPDIAAITNIAPVHLKPDQALINVAKAKVKIFTSMHEGQTAILYKEMEYYDFIEAGAKAHKLNIITFGQGENVDIKVNTSESGSEITAFGEKYLISEKPVPTHLLFDLSIVIGVLHALNLPVEKAINIFENFSSLEGRGEVTTGNIDSERKITLVDEAFNANPLSMKFTLEGFNKIYGKNTNKLLILGDMAEGGPLSLQQHLKLAKSIHEIEPTRILLCGEQMYFLWSMIGQMYNGKYYKNISELLEELDHWIVNDDYIFVKASHSIELYKVVQTLKNKIKNNS